MGLKINCYADFSVYNLGKVHPKEIIKITGIKINQGARSGNTIVFNATLSPTNTTQDTLIWNVDNTKVSLQPNGKQCVMTILSGADNTEVNITCKSAYNPSIKDSINLTVTYDPTIVIPIEEISEIQTQNKSGNKVQCRAILKPTDTTETGIIWSILNGSATIDANGLLSYSDSGTVTIKAASSVKPSISNTKVITVTYVDTIVEFEDSKVKARLLRPMSRTELIDGTVLATLDPDGDGEITQSMIEKIKKLSLASSERAFTNTDIEYFDEFKYFINLKDEGTAKGIDDLFVNCSSLKRITLPSTITTIPNGMFKNCSSLNDAGFNWNGATPESVNFGAFGGTAIKNLVIPEGCTTIVGRNDSNQSLELCDIPSTVTTVSDVQIARNCSNLTKVIFRPVTPPTISTSFDYLMNSATRIYVPDASLEIYKNADVWKNIASKILPISSL